MTVAVFIELLGAPGNKGEIVNYACEDSIAIAKGDILGLVENRTISGATTNIMAAAGIAASEKVANDGQTQIGVVTNGIFDCIAESAIVAGELVIISGVNTVGKLQSGSVIYAILGKALSGAAAGNACPVKVSC